MSGAETKYSGWYTIWLIYSIEVNCESQDTCMSFEMPIEVRDYSGYGRGFKGKLDRKH